VRIIHNLSKEARKEIIEILLEKRSNKELADELGVSPASITKFLNEEIHPSDKTIERALEIADEKELEKIYKVIIDDILTSLKEFLNEVDSDNETIRRLREILKSLW